MKIILNEKIAKMLLLPIILYTLGADVSQVLYGTNSKEKDLHFDFECVILESDLTRTYENQNKKNPITGTNNLNNRAHVRCKRSSDL